MDQFRVALFSGNYNHIRDGVSLTLNRMVGFMQQHGVEFLIFAPTKPEPALEHNGTLASVPSKSIPGRPEYLISTGLPADRIEKLEAFKPDLVHIATPDILGYKALKWAQANNVPVVSSFHTHFASYLKYYKLQMLEPLGWAYFRWFYAQCEQVYVPTPSMAEELEKQGIETDLRIWARGIETDRFGTENRSEQWRKELGFKEGDLVITFISRLVWEKNLRIYANVVNRLMEKHDHVKGLVVGDGPAMEEMKQMMPKAVFTGFLTGKELSTAYASSDLFLFPSDTETFGNVTLEAMASGLPCVVADAVGSKSLVEHGQNGFLANVDNEAEFYDYTEQLVLNGNLRNEMSRKSVEKAEGYSWEVINGLLLEYYKDALTVRV
ncbi:MAG: glycosyltransferase family 4 protein [Balneolaceae bacterium]